jgi:hypothetical protein
MDVQALHGPAQSHRLRSTPWHCTGVAQRPWTSPPMLVRVPIQNSMSWLLRPPGFRGQWAKCPVRETQQPLFPLCSARAASKNEPTRQPSSADLLLDATKLQRRLSLQPYNTTKWSSCQNLCQTHLLIEEMRGAPGMPGGKNRHRERRLGQKREFPRWVMARSEAEFAGPREEAR